MDDTEKVKGRKTPEEKTEELLYRYNLFILSDTVFTKKVLAQIDVALNTIQDDPYYPIIPLIYFEGQTMEVVSERLNSHIRTVRRNKWRLLRHLAAILFSDDVINAIYQE